MDIWIFPNVRSLVGRRSPVGRQYILLLTLISYTHLRYVRNVRSARGVKLTIDLCPNFIWFTSAELAKYPNCCPKINKIPEFYVIFARKLGEFYIIITLKIKKILFPEVFFGRGEHVSLWPRLLRLRLDWEVERGLYKQDEAINILNEVS